MGGLKQKTDDYNYIWAKFLDPSDDAYDIENYNPDDIWKDPTREFYKNSKYDLRQFKLSLARLVKKVKEAHEQPSKFASLEYKLWGDYHLNNDCLCHLYY